MFQSLSNLYSRLKKEKTSMLHYASFLRQHLLSLLLVLAIVCLLLAPRLLPVSSPHIATFCAGGTICVQL